MNPHFPCPVFLDLNTLTHLPGNKIKMICLFVKFVMEKLNLLDERESILEYSFPLSLFLGFKA